MFLKVTELNMYYERHSEHGTMKYSVRNSKLETPRHNLSLISFVSSLLKYYIYNVLFNLAN